MIRRIFISLLKTKSFARRFSTVFNSDTQYLSVSNSFLEVRYDYLQMIFDQIERAELPFIQDIELVDGVLNIKYETNSRNGEYVLNRQRPNHQIWLSSPLSGPYRFDYDKSKKEWVNTQKGVEIIELLNREIKEIEPSLSFKLKPEI